MESQRFVWMRNPLRGGLTDFEIFILKELFFPVVRTLSMKKVRLISVPRSSIWGCLC